MLKLPLRKPVRLWWILVLAVGILVITAGITLAGDGTNPALSDPITPADDITPPVLPYVPNQIVVKFATWADPGEFDNFGSVTAVTQQMTHSGAYLLEVQPGVDIYDLTCDFDSMYAVEYAHPNYVVNRLHPVQGSYPFSDEESTGDYSNQAAAVLLDLENSHLTATGVGITVAILDGGVDATYPELSDVVTPGWDYVSDDNDPFDEAGGLVSGHGTFVAGVVHLAAPDAQIKSYRVINPAGYGDGFTLALAIEQAVDDGCNVINISLVLMEEHLAVRDAIDYAVAQGVTIVASAGNEGSAMDLFPAAYDNVISVAAVDSTMLLADFASYGTNIDICAPGTMIYSTYKDGLYAWWSGSSFAAPIVAGQVAMLREISPAASNLFLEYAITITGTNIDNINPDVSGQLGGGLTDPPASLSEINNMAMAAIMPDTLYFELYEGAMYLVNPMASAFLTSTNAPAAFTAEVVNDGHVFSWVMDSIGTTDDSVTVSVEPGGLTAGTFYDEVLYYVDNVPLPISLTICANVQQNETTDTAWLTPNVLLFQSDIGTYSFFEGYSILQSSNSPANFTAELNAGAQFTNLLTTSGVTDDSIKIIVIPSNIPTAGVYTDTVFCYVEGVDNPAVLPIYLEIFDPDFDTAWVVRDTGAYVIVEEGATTPVTGWLDIYSSNAPANYCVGYLHPPIFSSLPDTMGTTNGSLYFEADPTGLSAGVYFDTMLIWIDGVVNNPHRGVATLIVQQPGGGPTGDTCWVYPMYQAFYAPGGVDYLQYGSIFIGSSNAPAEYTVSVLDYPNFTVLPNDTGVTNDSLIFEVVSRSFTTPGIYVDTLLIDVDGVDNSPRIAVLYLQIYEPNSDSLWLIPDTLQIVVPEGSTTPFPAYSMLWSSYGPTAYTAFIDTTAQWISLLDSSGFTNDTVGVMIDPTGLAAGYYSEIIWYLADSISDQAYLHVHLTVGGGSTGDSAMLTPTYLYFNATDGDTTTQTGYSWLSSPNAPAAYTAMNDTSNFFLTLIDTAGMTNSNVGVRVNPTGLPTGTYWNYAWYSVDGMVGPSYLIAVLTIDSVITVNDSAWVIPDPLIFSAPFGSTGTMIDTAILFSSNLFSPWSGFVLGGVGSFMTLQDTTGLTNDSIIVWADPSGLAPGWYGDSVVMYVSGISQPVLLTVMLNVYTTDSVSGVQNFPNPFNPRTEISFSLGVASRVNLTVYNINGQLVTTLVDQYLEVGKHRFQFDGSSISSGVYFYRLQTETAIETRKMILLK